MKYPNLHRILSANFSTWIAPDAVIDDEDGNKVICSFSYKAKVDLSKDFKPRAEENEYSTKEELLQEQIEEHVDSLTDELKNEIRSKVREKFPDTNIEVDLHFNDYYADEGDTEEEMMNKLIQAEAAVDVKVYFQIPFSDMGKSIEDVLSKLRL